MNIQDSIEKKHYIATEHDVELLAAAHFSGDQIVKRSDGQYLRILVASLKAQFGNGHTAGRRRKLTAEDVNAQVAHLETTHKRFYGAVLKGVTTPDVEADETLDVDTQRARASVRNARAGFARSAASTVKAFLEAGGDIRGVDVNKVTKTELRAFARAAVAPDENPRLHTAHVSVQRLTRDLTALAKDDPDVARVAIDEAMVALQGLLDDLGAAPAATAPTESQVFRGRTRAAFAGRARAAA